MLLEIPNKTDEFIIWYYPHDIFICPTLVSRPLRRFGFSSWVPVYFLLAIPTFLASTEVGRVHRSPENKITEGGMSWMLLKRGTGRGEWEIEKRRKKHRIRNEATDTVCPTAVFCFVTQLVGMSVAWRHKERMLSRLLLIGLLFNLNFVPIFHFSVPRARKPLPVPCLINIRRLPTQATASRKNSPL